MAKTNIAVFASGRGSNFVAIAKAISKKVIKGANLSLLVCDNPSAPVVYKAKILKIKTALINPDLYASREDFEKKILLYLKEYKIKLIVLAGFMRMLSPAFVRTYRNRIINIHPSLLPAFKGSQAIRDAFEYGVKVTGVTVHFVDEKMDHGPVILQKDLKVDKNDTLVSLEDKIHRIEHKLYPQAIKLFVNNKLKVSGRKVTIKGSR